MVQAQPLLLKRTRSLVRAGRAARARRVSLGRDARLRPVLGGWRGRVSGGLL